MNVWDALNPQFIPHGILHSFSAGLTRQEALDQLLKAQKNKPRLLPRVDYRDVDFWYTSFEKDNYDLRQITKYPQLENLPVLDHVIHEVGTSEQKALHAASDVMKGMIENENRLYNSVELRLYSNFIKLKVEFGLTEEVVKTVYTRKENGCEIGKAGVVSRSEQGIFENALPDFKKTVEKIHTKIGRLVIRSAVKQFEEGDRLRFLAGVSEIMSSLKEPLHVENFSMTVKTSEEMDILLKFIKPGVLEELDVDVDDEGLENDRVFTMSRAHNLSFHWKTLKDVSISTLKDTDMNLLHFTHIPSVYVCQKSISNEEIKKYRDTIRNFQQLIRHEIMIDSTRGTRTGWKKALEPFDSTDSDSDADYDEEFADIEGSWPFPGDDNSRLCFKIKDYSLKFLKKTN